MNGYGFDMWWGGGLLMILFWVVVIALAIWVLRWLFAGSQSQQPATTQSAVDVAKARYARGEISREQYRALIEDLSSQKE